MPPDPLDVIRARGGVATTRVLRDGGVPRRALDRALSAGRLQRVREGVYCDPELPSEVVHALLHGGRLACVSAAKAYGLWTLEHDRLHLAMTPGRHEHRHVGCSPVLHWNPHDEARHPLVVPLFLALVQIAGCLGAEALICALDSALHTGRLPIRALPALRAAVPPALRAVVDAANPLADSGLESLTRWRLLKVGVVAVPAHEIPGVGPMNLLVGDRLIIELDGGTHDTAEQRRRDARREAAAVAQGYLVLRFDYAQVMYRWPDVEAAVLAVVDRGLHLDPPRAGQHGSRTTRRLPGRPVGVAAPIRADSLGGRGAEGSR